MRKFNVILLLVITFILTGSVTWLALDNISPEIEVTEIRMILKTKPDRLSFWSQMTEGAFIAGTEYDAHIVVDAPERETNVEEQIQMVRRAIEDRVEAIIIAATDYNDLSDVCNEAMDEGIIVVAIDSDIELDKDHSYIATNNINAAKRLSHELATLLGNQGNILIVGHVKGASTSVDRILGFEQGVKNNENIRILDPVLYSDDNEEAAYRLIKEFVKKDIDFDAVYATNEVALTGVGRAISDLKLEKDIMVVGFDVNNKIMEMLQNGAIDITMIQRPFNMGYLAVEEVIRLLDSKDVQVIDTGSVMITKDVMFYPENQRLLVPGAREYRSE